MVTELESDLLVCEVKWALGSMTTNKASGDDGIPAEILKILKDDAAHATHLENSAATSKLEKVCFHSNSKGRQCQRMFKLPYNCTHFTC